ncbi:hypothetical protein BC830DRAFT_1230359 [Chytriomyces sp. MP71]|nr:hypothetical protein BC830DRAFT_1230359 [Chytriomyces sp. MP71]
MTQVVALDADAVTVFVLAKRTPGTEEQLSVRYHSHALVGHTQALYIHFPDQLFPHTAVTLTLPYLTCVAFSTDTAKGRHGLHTWYGGVSEVVREGMDDALAVVMKTGLWPDLWCREGEEERERTGNGTQSGLGPGMHRVLRWDGSNGVCGICDRQG